MLESRDVGTIAESVVDCWWGSLFYMMIAGALDVLAF
jgi:cobalamin biosynthesis protein CobD/CbiB